MVIIGYSWGAQTSVNIAQHCKTVFEPIKLKVGAEKITIGWHPKRVCKPYPVDLAFTIDPIGRPNPLGPINVNVQKLADKWVNYYQTSDTLTLVPFVLGLTVRLEEREVMTLFGKKKMLVPADVKLEHGLKGQRLAGAENVPVTKEQLEKTTLPDGTKGDPRHGHIFIPYNNDVLNRLTKEVGTLKQN